MDVISDIPTAPIIVNEKFVRDDADPVSCLCIFSSIAVAKGLEMADIIIIGAKHTAKARGDLCPMRNISTPNRRQIPNMPNDTRYELAFRILIYRIGPSTVTSAVPAKYRLYMVDESPNWFS